MKKEFWQKRKLDQDIYICELKYITSTEADLKKRIRLYEILESAKGVLKNINNELKEFNQ